MCAICIGLNVPGKIQIVIALFYNEILYFSILQAKNFFIGVKSNMGNKYFLITKYSGKSFAQYKGTARSISETIPKTVDEVWVGVVKHPEKIRKITTFRDEKGNIIERAFDYSDNKLRNRIYSRQSINISEDEFVNSVSVTDYFINKRMIPYYEKILDDYKDTQPLKSILWNIKEIVTNHTSINKKTGEKILSQTRIDNFEMPTKQRHTFIEFPSVINKKIQNSKKKILSFLVNAYKNQVIQGSELKIGTRYPKNDTYLAYRALSINDAKAPLTRKFIKEKKLDNDLIEINPDYYPKNKDELLYDADFDPEDGSINFNRFSKLSSKARVAEIARHESEHAWQYFLHSRYAEPTTEWETFVSENFSKIKSKKLLQEAKRYTKSIKGYVALTKDLEEAGNIQKYRSNYIEKKASKAGAKIKKEYNRQGKVIRNNFKHIPKEYL